MRWRVFDIAEFAETLRMTRASRRVTCRELERISGISHAFLNQVENHRRVPAINSILWLCDWMGRDLSVFIKQFSHPGALPICDTNPERAAPTGSPVVAEESGLPVLGGEEK